jgi:hypothetical protein
MPRGVAPHWDISGRLSQEGIGLMVVSSVDLILSLEAVYGGRSYAEIFGLN